MTRSQVWEDKEAKEKDVGERERERDRERQRCSRWRRAVEFELGEL
jgi:hypothetical protein